MSPPKTKKLEAIILNTKPFGEKDRLVEIFSREQGRQKAIAKSAATLKSKLRGHIEPTSHVEIVLYQGKSLDLITEAQTITAFPEIRTSWDRLQLAGYFLQVVRNVTVEHQHNPQLFDILQTALHQANSHPDTAGIKAFFERELLKAEGVWDENWEQTGFETQINSYCERVSNGLHSV